VNNQSLRVPRRIFLAPGSTLSVRNKAKSGTALGGKEGGIDEIKFGILQRASTDNRDVFIHCLLRRRRKHLKTNPNSYPGVLFVSALLAAPGNIFVRASRTILLYMIASIGFCSPHCGATVYHSNGSVVNVQALIDTAHDGDTITVPAGTFTWGSPLTVTKGITLKGATTISGPPATP
jgi:hypothetical protein